MISEKSCKKCGAVRDVGKRCAPCRRAELAAYYQAKREDFSARNKAYYEENREDCLSRSRRTKATRVEPWPESYRTKHAEWRRKNRDIEAAIKSRRRARDCEAVGSYTAGEWIAKKASSGFRCVDCGMREGNKFKNGKVMKLTVGHAVPLSRGGSNFIINIIAQCGPCNSKQHDKVHPSVHSNSLFDRTIAA